MSALHDLKQQVLEANLRLPSSGLVRLTWGNVSGIHRTHGHVVIKPSGVPYPHLRDDDMVVLDVETGRKIEGALNASSDAATHLALYRAWPAIGGICHTHSPFATAWAQSGRPLPCYGTTHADHFYGTVPLCRVLTPEEVAAGYEALTGAAIVETFRAQNIDPSAIPGVLQHHHAPFTWGKDALDALNNSLALEMCAKIALDTLRLDPNAPPLPQHLLDKHFRRKHGPDAYYGQSPP
jgi:L-ribulose-5-phosphate 4-epimerase